MKLVLLSVLLAVTLAAAISPAMAYAGAVPLSESSMARTVGRGTEACETLSGFRTAVGFGAAVSALVPGGQSAALILGLTAASTSLVYALAC